MNSLVKVIINELMVILVILYKNQNFLVFNSSLAAAANSIVSGGAAERMSFFGYILLSIFFSGWIYPVVISWCYNSNGW